MTKELKLKRERLLRRLMKYKPLNIYFSETILTGFY
jgi:hypothetical protein